jgi:uncharacterized protein with PIN domain
MKFVVDGMLGKLAKWLKILGFDVLFFSNADDDTLLNLARREGRTLLSRDLGLIARAKGVKSLAIESENWEEQVRQVLDHFNLRSQVRPYTRCLECNTLLKILPKRMAVNLVTPFVYEQGSSFAICASCGRVYWQGTHFEAMRAEIERLLEKPFRPD